MNHNESLSNRLSQKISTSVLILVGLIAISLFLASYLISKHLFNQQVQTWVSLIPEYTLSNLIDSDDFAIKKELEFIRSTELFRSFQIKDSNQRIIGEFGKISSAKNIDIPIKDTANVSWGYFSYSTKLYTYFIPFLIFVLTALCLICILYIIVRKFLNHSLDIEFRQFSIFLAEISELTKNIASCKNNQEILQLQHNGHNSYYLEQQKINDVVQELLVEINKSHAALREAVTHSEQEKTQSALAKIALQVGHDIRSPLAALEMSMQMAASIPEQQRILMRSATNRIRDIANDLVEKNLKNTDNELSQEVTTQLLSSVIHILVTEKRLQYRAFNEVDIQTQFNNDSYGLFANIITSNFKRVLSNIINNSIEAINGHLKITISLFSNDQNIFIKIEDNGKGIPSEIMPEIGNFGKSYGKEHGLGLGLYHAKTTVQSFGGDLKVESKLNVGTTVLLKLPKANTPEWFVSELKITPHTLIIILDDDSSIHEVWKERFRSIFPHESYQLIHSYSTRELEEFIKNSENLNSCSTLYLFDYEIIGSHLTGLDLIEKLGIKNNSILVTSRFEEPDIITRCKIADIKVIPKDLASIMPISFS